MDSIEADIKATGDKPGCPPVCQDPDSWHTGGLGSRSHRQPTSPGLTICSLSVGMLHTATYRHSVHISRNELVMIVITMTNVIIIKDALCQKEYFLKELYSEMLSGPQNRNHCGQHPQEHKQLNSWSTHELPTESIPGPPVMVAPSLHSCQAESFHSSGGKKVDRGLRSWVRSVLTM